MHSFGVGEVTVVDVFASEPRAEDIEERPARWLICALVRARQDAQIEADLAYEAWHALRSEERRSEYRTAQDRADALASDLEQLARVCAPADAREALKSCDAIGLKSRSLMDSIWAWLTTAVQLYGETFRDRPADVPMT